MEWNEKNLWKAVDKVLEECYDETARRWDYTSRGNEYEELRADLFDKAYMEGKFPSDGMLEEIIENYARWYNEEHQEYDLSVIADAEMERMKEGGWAC
jgi:hypothetical protein